MLTSSISETLGSISGHNLHDLKIMLPVTGIFAHDFGGIASGLSKKERTISVAALVENSLVVASLACQYLQRGSPLPVPVQMVLGPFLAFEAWLKIATIARVKAV